MSERHAAPAFDNSSQHSFDRTCTQGIQLDANSFGAYGIKREKNSEYTETDYPNGISVTRFKEGDFAIGYPDDYKHNEDKDGLSKITDKEGHAVAYLSAGGNLLIAAGDKVLQENKNARVSLTEISCFDKPGASKQEQKTERIEMPELVITGRVPKSEVIVMEEIVITGSAPLKPQVIEMPEMVIIGRVPGGDKDDKPRKEPKANEPKAFNWDSDDPLEGIDVSGF